MPRHLHLDYETFSEAELKDVGAYRYARDNSTEILCAAMALDDEEPWVWQPGADLSEDDFIFNRYLEALEDPSVLCYAHNAMFEIAISAALTKKTWGIEPPSLDRWRCTMSMARRAALPSGLDQLSDVLNLTHRKDKRGKALIKMFSVMQTAKKPTKKNPAGLPVRRIRPEDEPEAFAEFMRYCAQDVRAEQEVASKLRYFDEPINNENFVLDQVINARGVPVNLDALRHAQKLIEEETEVVSRQFRELVGFEVTQNAVFLAWLKERGYPYDDLQAETVETCVEEFEDDPVGEHADVVRALRMKQSIAYAAIKKIPTMLACAGPGDNRIRGLLNHHGTTPGRWTGSLVQPQNFKKSSIKDSQGNNTSESAYRAICSKVDLETLRLTYGAPLEVIASSIRHFIHDIDQEDFCDVCRPQFPLEREMLDCDYAAVQARIVAWLAGQEDVLEQYRAYDAAKTKEEKYALDPYRILAATIFSIALAEVQKHPHRLVGKHARLGLGFQMGAAKFRDTVKKLARFDLPEGLEFTAVKVYRDVSKCIVSYWWDVDDAAKRAISRPGEQFGVQPRSKAYSRPDVKFLCREIEGILYLLIRLPSGRKLSYPWPEVHNGRIAFYGNIKGTTWGRIDTYGGKLTENITMGVEADILFHGIKCAERHGYQIATLIHDQALAYYDAEKGQTAEEFERLLVDLPAWAKGLPLAAEGGLVPFYKKDS